MAGSVTPRKGGIWYFRHESGLTRVFSGGSDKSRAQRHSPTLKTPLFYLSGDTDDNARDARLFAGDYA
jgi:hypothetical protein